MRMFLSIITFVIFSTSCNTNKPASSKLNGVNYNWLDSVKQAADTTYTKKYGTIKFATAQYFISKKDSTLCQVMKDTAGIIRQVVVTKHNRRTFFAGYYANGQLMAQLLLDSFGEYHGAAKYFYQNGSVETEGSYSAGLKTDQWKNYNEMGKPVSTTEYDTNGQVIKTIGEK